MSIDKIRCNFTKCYAGMGVAGNRVCFLGGDYTDPSCPAFLDEEIENLKSEKNLDK